MPSKYDDDNENENKNEDDDDETMSQNQKNEIIKEKVIFFLMKSLTNQNHLKSK